MVTCRTHALCSRVTSLIGSCAFSFGDRVSLCRVGSANGNHSGFQLVTCFRKPTFRNGYIWVTIPQVTRKQCIKNNSYGYCGLRWYIILNTKIVPSNINDPRKHLQHRDQRGSTSNLWMLHHGKQVENLMRLLGKLSGIQGTASFWERTEAPLPPPRPGCNFIHPKQLSPFPERLELPFPSEEILSGYEDVVSSRQDQYTTWVKTDPDVTSERHMVDVQKAVAEFREASARRHDTSSQEYHFDNNVPYRLPVQKRLSIYNWNPAPRRGKEGAFEKQIAGKWHCRYSDESVSRDLPWRMRGALQQGHLLP